MKELIRVIHLIAPYLVIPILMAGFYKWSQLRTPFRIYIIGAVLSTVVTLLRAYIQDKNVSFYISALLGVTIYGCLFHSILRKVIYIQAIWVCVACIWIIIGWYSIQHGITNFQLRIIIPFDLFMITFSGIYIVNSLNAVRIINSSVFFLVLYLLMEFCVNLFLDMISNFLYAYFSNQFMFLLWNEILPIYTVVKISLIIWIILSVKPKTPSLDKMPAF